MFIELISLIFFICVILFYSTIISYGIFLQISDPHPNHYSRWCSGLNKDYVQPNVILNNECITLTTKIDLLLLKFINLFSTR